MTLTLQEAIDLCWETRSEWINSKRDGQTTIRCNIKNVLKYVPGETLIDTIKPSTFTKLGRAMQRDGFANGTCNRVMSLLSTVLRNAHLEDELDSVPSYKRLKEPPSMHDVYSQDEMLQLMEASLELKEDRVLMQRTLTFFWFTGVRKSELMRIKWRDETLTGEVIDCVDFENNKLHFLDTKADLNHSISIHAELLPMLKEMHKERIDDDLVFKWHHRDTLNRRMNELKKITGLGGKRAIHQIRHSVASALVNQVELVVIQKLLGHKSFDTTLRYAKASEEMIDQAIESLHSKPNNETNNRVQLR